MPNLNIFPSSFAILSGSAVTTNGTSSAFSLPLGQCYRMTVELLTASSTTTNHSVSLFSSSAGSSGVYHGILALTALTTSGQAISAVFRPYLGVGDTGTTVTSAILGTTDFATNANVVVNGPFDPRYLKLRWQTSSNGTCTFNVNFDVVEIGDQV